MTTILTDDPLYQIGERYILFLRKSKTSTDLYLVVSPQGRFLSVEGRISPVTPQDVIGSKYMGWTEENFIQEIVQVLR